MISLPPNDITRSRQVRMQESEMVTLGRITDRWNEALGERFVPVQILSLLIAVEEQTGGALEFIESIGGVRDDD